MENYLSNETKNSLNELIDFIKNSNEYKECIRLKKEIDKDMELTSIINKVRYLQRDYIKSGYDKKVKEELDEEMNKLNNSKLYILYSYNLDKVNEMINIIKEELNSYFYNITNILN